MPTECKIFSGPFAKLKPISMESLVRPRKETSDRNNLESVFLAEAVTSKPARRLHPRDVLNTACTTTVAIAVGSNTVAIGHIGRRSRPNDDCNTTGTEPTSKSSVPVITTVVPEFTIRVDKKRTLSTFEKAVSLAGAKRLFFMGTGRANLASHAPQKFGEY
jgi:hypothetical protein